MSPPSEADAFSLLNVASGLHLGIKDDATYAGAEVVLSTATNGATPEWSLQAEQGANYIVNALEPSMCLNVAYERKTVGGGLQQWHCNGGASELWTLVELNGGNVALVNRNSGLAVGPSGLEAGSSIIQLESINDARAGWKIIRDDKAPGAFQLSSSVSKSTFRPTLTTYAPTLVDEMIYNIYVPIYSSSGNLVAVTQDLPRIAELGFSTILLMPIHPIGVPVGKHPACGSPYAVSDFYDVDPALGQLSDFEVLVQRAHSLGLKIIMDMVLNHTAWNHSFITQRPDWYVHTSRKKKGPDTIAHAFWFKDVAQLDYKSGPSVARYLAEMLAWWVQSFKVDGFRFDTVDNPPGKDRMIPASVWSHIGNVLKSINARIILLGECTNPELSLRPFNIDYTNYSLQPAVMNATRTKDARSLPTVLYKLKAEHPAGMLHTSIMQTWDMDLDLRMYGGPDATMAAAVFNFTVEGVPMIFAGEEVCNDRGGVNTHAVINWHGPLAERFHAFYKSLGMLRRERVSLRRGSTAWPRVLGASPGLIAFLRTWEGEQCLIAINISARAVNGQIDGQPSCDWEEVTPPGALHGSPHSLPPMIVLGPWDFAIFARRY